MMPPRSVPLQTAPSGFAKDPRELRQKPAQYAMWDTVLQWLRQTGFDTQGLKLTSITAQSFRAIFEHLILTILDDYTFTPVQDSRERGAKMDKEKGKWEQEFLTVLAFLGYPFISTVDQKWLATPSAPYSWPSLLAALHWTTELAKVSRVHRH
jgi:kinetochore protein NDC80